MMRAAPRTPLWFRAALRLLIDAEQRTELLAELSELYEHRVARDGESAAQRWYARQLRGYPSRLLRMRLTRTTGDASSEIPQRSESWLQTLRGDATHAGRTLLKAPALALTVILTVGLGLGASTAMFAIVNVVLLHPLPYRSAGELQRIYHAIGENRWNLSVADYLAIEAQQTHFDGVAAFTTGERTLISGDGAERVRTRAVTAGWFDLLGVRAQHGRTFTSVDGIPGTPRTAVVSWGFWQRRMGGDRSAVGSMLRLDDEDHRIIGVLPRATGPFEERIDVFPVMQLEPPPRKGPFLLSVVGRLPESESGVAAVAELQAINRRIFPLWQATGWSDTNATYGMMPLAEFVVGRFRTVLIVLLAAVGMVLLVASTNAASLLTARTLQRRAELATRAALGASRGRLARLLVTESALLATGGALFGLVFAAAVLRLVRNAGPTLLPRSEAITLTPPVLLFAAILAGASLLLFGIVPVVQLLRRQTALAATLRSGGRTMTDSISAQRTRRTLVAAQFALAVPLLAGAALLLNTFLRLQRVDPGFDDDGVVTMRITRSEARDTSPAMAAAFWRELLTRVGELPSVQSAGVNSARPPREAANINNFDLLDKPVDPGESEPMAVWLVASPGYFDALGVRLLAGRMFDSRDDSALGVTSALVDRTWAESMYPGEAAVGRRMYEGGCRAAECQVVEVVGVVENVRYTGLDNAQTGGAVGTVYVPQSQWLEASTNLFVRAAGNPLDVVAAVRRVVTEIDPTAPITDIVTGTELIDNALTAPRNLAVIVLGFAAVALLLAMVGIYGVMSYFVNEHRKDIGIRLVLGGAPASVLALVLVRGMLPVVAGSAAGFIIALLATRSLARLLYSVSPRDPLTLALVALALLATALVACWLPARRAATIEPLHALRAE